MKSLDLTKLLPIDEVSMGVEGVIEMVEEMVEETVDEETVFDSARFSS